MRRLIFFSLIIMISCIAPAQTAKTVLDRAAATISDKNGVSAQFKITSDNYGTTSGTIYVKGRKFHATTTDASVWFDGKTQWTYVTKNEEVNISTPSEGELQAINPYNFINIYKRGFSYDIKLDGNTYRVHLTAADKKRKIREMYIHVNKSSFVPTVVKMLQGSRWTTITISRFRATPLSDAMFVFDKSKYAHAEIIDLR